MHVKPSKPMHVKPTALFEILRETHSAGVCCCLQTYNLNVGMDGVVLGQSWMVLPMNRYILLCPPIIMYCEVCCCLHIHSVVNVLVMGLILGRSLMFISTMGILLYPKVCPFYNWSALLSFTRKLHCLQTFEHMSELLAPRCF